MAQSHVLCLVTGVDVVEGGSGGEGRRMVGQ